MALLAKDGWRARCGSGADVAPWPGVSLRKAHQRRLVERIWTAGDETGIIGSRSDFAAGVPASGSRGC